MNYFERRRIELSNASRVKGKDAVTQADIADRAGGKVTVAMVGYWERGFTVPKLKYAPQLARAYRTTQGKIQAEILRLSRAAAKK